MSYNDSSATLDLTLAPSLRAVGVVVVLHVLAIVLMLLAHPQKVVMLILLALFIASWASLRRHAAFGYGPRALRRLIAHGDGSWTVETAATSEHASLLPGSFVNAALIVIRFQLASGKIRARVLWGDELPADALRRLRARILLGSKVPESAEV
jgi:hypothetical protein